MGKQRHNQNTPEPDSRGPLVMLAIGALLVAGLVVWALTRTVETPATPLPSIAETTMPATDTSTFTSASTTAIDTSGFTPTTTTAGITTSSQAPVIEGNKSEVGRISAEDLNEKVKAGTVTVVDVRDTASFDAAHIPGAIHIPMASVESNLDLLPKGKEIVTYCTWPAEETSAGAALIMKNHGYNNVSALYGGLAAWRNLNYPLDKK